MIVRLKEQDTGWLWRKRVVEWSAVGNGNRKCQERAVWADQNPSARGGTHLAVHALLLSIQLKHRYVAVPATDGDQRVKSRKDTGQRPDRPPDRRTVAMRKLTLHKTCEERQESLSNALGCYL